MLDYRGPLLEGFPGVLAPHGDRFRDLSGAQDLRLGKDLQDFLDGFLYLRSPSSPTVRSGAWRGTETVLLRSRPLEPSQGFL